MVASQQEGPEFESTGQLWSFCVEFAFSPLACLGSHMCCSSLPPCKDMYVRLTGESRFTDFVNMNGYLSLSVRIAIEWQPVQAVPHLSPPSV